MGVCVSNDSDLHVVLCQPEIPPNTGNIIRLCANTGMALHIIEPLGFELDDTRLRRAGLDYHEYADIQTWRDLASYQRQFPQRRLVAVETSGRQSYASFRFESGDSLLFGSETSGLSAHTLGSLPTAHVLKVPMKVTSRSLNLSNTVAVVVYEAWRQLGFYGSE
jgi:tRNA (cytidine/uridine-2'-O-)-methyltransferase